MTRKRNVEMTATNFNKIGKIIFVHKLKQFTASGLLEDDERLQRVQLSTPQ
jgi:hypothetical protein